MPPAIVTIFLPRSLSRFLLCGLSHAPFKLYARLLDESSILLPKKARTSSTKSLCHPSPPTQTIGGQGRFCREKLRCPPIRGTSWRRGSVSQGDCASKIDELELG